MFQRRLPRGLAMAAGFLMLICGGRAGALAPTQIGGCTTLSTPGFYEIESKIITSTVGPCIDITAAGVTLSLESGGLQGDGSHGTGIRIEHGAAGTVIQGWLTQQGGPAVTAFDIGVEDDQGGSVIGGFQASGNATTGLLLSHADGDVVMALSAANNGHDGIHIMQTAGARLEDTTAKDNGTYGFWLDGASGTLLDRDGASGNGTTNVELSKGGATASSKNFIYDLSSHDAPNGIVIEKKNGGNRITRSGPYNGNPASVEDAFDHNAKCGTNLWFNNIFAGARPGCVH